MLIDAVRRLSPFDRLCYWVRERESIRLKKEAGKSWPWTDDSILQSYRFCNVVRADDKVSRWLFSNFYETPTFSSRDPARAVVAACLARHFNQPITLRPIQRSVYNNTEPDWDHIKEVVRGLKASGQTVFNSAYMVRGVSNEDKTEMVVERVAKPLWTDPPKIDTGSMKRSVEALLPYWGLSSFMAGQIVADLRWVLNGTWTDRDSWAPLGPGSKRGMNRAWGRAVDAPTTQERFLEDLEELIARGRKQIPKDLADRMEAMDWQSVCCEYDKYTRALLGEGRPKQRYTNRT